MKKVFKLFGLPLMTFAAAVFGVESCTQDVLVDVNQSSLKSGREITFYSDIISRGIATTNANIDSIWIYAYTKEENETGEDVIPGVLFVKDKATQTFISEKKYYWPDKGTVHFKAMYPSPEKMGISTDKIFNEDPTTDSSKGIISGDTVKYLVKNKSQMILGNYFLSGLNNGYFTSGNLAAKDIVFAEAEGSKDSNEQTGVSLNFKHALSQVEVRVKYVGSEYVIASGGVRFKFISNVGTFDANNFVWSGLNAIKKGDFDNLASETSLNTRSNPIPLGAEPVTITTELGNRQIPGTQTGNLLIIPQKHDAWDVKADKTNERNGTVLALSLQILKNGKNIIDFDSWSPERKEASSVLYSAKYKYVLAAIPVEANWEAGKKYIYTVELSDEALGYYLPVDPDKPGEPILGNPIKIVNVTVEDWDDGDDVLLEPNE